MLMTKQITRYAAIALFASVLLISNTISFADAQTTNIRYKGQSADAAWYFEQDEVYTNVYVFATDSSSRQKSDTFTDSVSYVGISQYKLGDEVCYEYDGEQYCWNEYVPIQEYFGYGTITSENFQTQGRLDGATLDATLTGHNYLTESDHIITVNIDWTGEGDYSSGKSSYHYRSGEYMYNGNYVSFYRQATATGTIGGDIKMDLGSSSWGSLYNAKTGYVDVIHP